MRVAHVRILWEMGAGNRPRPPDRAPPCLAAVPFLVGPSCGPEARPWANVSPFTRVRSFTSACVCWTETRMPVDAQLPGKTLAFDCFLTPESLIVALLQDHAGITRKEPRIEHSGAVVERSAQVSAA